MRAVQSEGGQWVGAMNTASVYMDVANGDGCQASGHPMRAWLYGTRGMETIMEMQYACKVTVTFVLRNLGATQSSYFYQSESWRIAVVEALTVVLSRSRLLAHNTVETCSTCQCHTIGFPVFASHHRPLSPPKCSV